MNRNLGTLEDKELVDIPGEGVVVVDHDNIASRQERLMTSIRVGMDSYRRAREQLNWASHCGRRGEQHRMSCGDGEQTQNKASSVEDGFLYLLRTGLKLVLLVRIGCVCEGGVSLLLYRSGVLYIVEEEKCHT